MSGIKAAIASRSLKSAIKSNATLAQVYDKSFEVLKDLSDHYTGFTLSPFFQNKGRFLLSSQATFLIDEVKAVIKEKGDCRLLDVGDSDGSLQLLIQAFAGANGHLKTTGVNIQSKAVERIRMKGLEAIEADAMTLAERGLSFNILAVMETLEHLANPIGFLEEIHKVVGDRLIISVPYVRKSRVALSYLNFAGSNEKATVENVHFFELSPGDWTKIFRHCGWRINRQWTAFQFGPGSVWRLTAPIWRKIDFEGFWMVSLVEDLTLREHYIIE